MDAARSTLPVTNPCAGQLPYVRPSVVWSAVSSSLQPGSAQPNQYVCSRVHACEARRSVSGMRTRLANNAVVAVDPRQWMRTRSAQMMALLPIASGSGAPSQVPVTSPAR